MHEAVDHKSAPTDEEDPNRIIAPETEKRKTVQPTIEWSESSRLQVEPEHSEPGTRSKPLSVAASSVPKQPSRQPSKELSKRPSRRPSKGPTSSPSKKRSKEISKDHSRKPSQPGLADNHMEDIINTSDDEEEPEDVEESEKSQSRPVTAEKEAEVSPQPANESIVTDQNKSDEMMNAVKRSGQP